MGGMASAAANDIKNAFNYKNLPAKTAARHLAKTKTTMEREEKRNAASGESTSPAKVAAAMLAESNRNLAIQGRAKEIYPVAGAPSVPDPNAIGETEQALLDAQKTGRSSTIATSAKGLLSDEDDTRKKRSLMGGLIT